MGYPKGTKGYIFYDPQDQKIFVSTNARFLEEDYIIDNKPTSRLILEEMREKDSNDPIIGSGAAERVCGSKQTREGCNHGFQ